MQVSAATNPIAQAVLSSANPQVESKNEGKQPDGDKDDAGRVAQPATASSIGSSGSIINTTA